MHSPLDTFHIPIVQSADPDVKYSPQSENAILNTKEECSSIIFIRSPFYTIYIVLSTDSEAEYSQFGENFILSTPKECPVRF